jgi:hypothetical protein
MSIFLLMAILLLAHVMFCKKMVDQKLMRTKKVTTRMRSNQRELGIVPLHVVLLSLSLFENVGLVMQMPDQTSIL